MEQRSKEWFELRKKYIGASDASSILGISPWKNIYELWLEKTSDEIKVSHQNEWMKRGIDLEPEALEAFERETGYLMSPHVLISPRNVFMMASLDGFEMEGLAAVEIKCPGRKDHEYALDGQIPEKYIPQLQHQIEVTGLDKIYYCSYSPDHVKPLYIKEVYRDQPYIDNLIHHESKFYHDHMITGIPPENPIRTINSEQWKLLSNEYRRLDFEAKEAEKRKEEIKDLLLQISGAQNAKGNGIILQKIERKGIIDYKNIPELKKVDTEKYRKPSISSWRIMESNYDSSTT